MKRLLVVLFLILCPINVNAISASSAIAIDRDTGRVLYGYNIDEKRLIASTTKIMTAIVAIENADISKEIEVTDVIYKAFGSAIYIEVGEKITLKDLLYGLLLRSGNDAALMIAEAVSNDVSSFVFLMNEYKDNLGMNNTYFYNPHGLEENDGSGNISTAKDLAILTKYAMQNSTFREIFGTKKYTVKTNYKTYVWHNKNKLLSLDYITGGKTGYTEKAKRTLVTTGSKDNINIIVVTLNDPNDWDDHKTIYNSIFNKYQSYKLIDKNKFRFKENNYYEKDNLFLKNDYFMTLTKDELKSVYLNINLLKTDNYRNDDIVGYVEVILDKTIYHKEPIHIKNKKEEDNTSWWKKFKERLFKW